jgi:hypothetical protein
VSPAESWPAWTTRVAADLAALTEGDWLTFAVRVDESAPSPDVARPTRRRWRPRGVRPVTQPRVPEALVQVRLVEGVLALECISDTEFEGVSDLSRADEAALAALGWGRDGAGSELSRVFGGPPAEGPAQEAAGLLRETLGGVLGAASPDDVVVRRAT